MPRTTILQAFISRRGPASIMVLYAKDILETEFLSLTPETTVLDATKRMKDSKHGFAMIGPPSKPLGMVTEWDIVSKVVAEGKNPSSVKLGDIMSTDLIFVDSKTGIAAISQLMTEKGVRRLLVKEGDQIVGFVTSKTILARLNEYVDRVSTQISRLQAPWY